MPRPPPSAPALSQLLPLNCSHLVVQRAPIFTPNMSDGVPACCSAVGDMLGYSAESPLAWVSATPFIQPRIPSCSHLVTLFAAVPYKSKLRQGHLHLCDNVSHSRSTSHVGEGRGDREGTTVHSLYMNIQCMYTRCVVAAVRCSWSVFTLFLLFFSTLILINIR